MCALDDAPLAGHDRIALPEVPPTGGEREVVARHVAAVDGGGYGDGRELRAQRALRNAGDGCVRIEEPRKLPTPRGRSSERRRGVVGVTIRPAGKRNARPFHLECSGIGLAVSGIVEGGEDMVEKVFDVCAKVLKIPLRGTRQVGSVHGLPTVSCTFLNKPSGEHQCRAFNQMQRAQMLGKAGLWFRSAPSQVLRSSQPQISVEHVGPVVGYGTTKQAMPRFPVEPAIVERPVGVADKASIDGCPACKERVTHGAGIAYDEP